jgi:hypothetical protein
MLVVWFFTRIFLVIFCLDDLLIARGIMPIVGLNARGKCEKFKAGWVHRQVANGMYAGTKRGITTNPVIMPPE